MILYLNKNLINSIIKELYLENLNKITKQND